jgi:hypothetical protein
MRSKKKSKINKKLTRRQKGANKTVAYVINLDKRINDRWPRIQNDFKDTEITLERFPAILHENGHIGLANSYKELVKMAKEKNMDSILIFEDDCTPIKGFNRRWAKVKEWLDNNKDSWETFNGGIKWPLDTEDIVSLDKDINLIRSKSKGGRTAHFVLINKTAYDKVLEYDFEKNGLFDYFINSSHFKNVFITPNLCVQHGGMSNTEKHVRADYNSNILEQESGIQNAGNTVLIRHPVRREYSPRGFYLYPILKNIFPDKKIVFTTDINEKCDLIIKSYWDNFENDEKYIFISAEPNDLYFAGSHNILSNKCIACLMTSKKTIENYKQHKPDIQYFYLPYFLDRDNENYELSPFVEGVRVETNKNREKIAAYIAQQSPPHRDEMFKALYKLDPTVEALGKANKTINYDFPYNGWMNLTDIYKNYKFVFTMENSYEDGYISEKIMNAYIAGAIPIYWGTNEVKNIFNPESFIYVNDYIKEDNTTDYDSCARKIIEIANNPEKLSTMQNASVYISNTNPDYSKYYDTISPQWVIDIANFIKDKIIIKGGKKNRAKKIKTRKIKKLRKQNGGEVTVHYITVSTKDKPELQKLIQSGKNKNIDIKVLGLDLDTTKLGHANSGKFGMKLRLPKEYIKLLNDDDIIVFTDAWDVIYYNDTAALLDRYKLFNKDIVVGGEKVCWPDSDKAKEFTDTADKPFPYLNSGGYIANVKGLKKILANYDESTEVDDQRFWIDMYFKNKDTIVLDTNATIFLNTCATDKNNYDVSNNKFIYKETNTQPLLIHANGVDKSYLDLFYKNMKLICTEHVGAGFFSNFMKIISFLVTYPNIVELQYDMKATSPGNGMPFVSEGTELLSLLLEPYSENKNVDYSYKCVKYFDEMLEKIKPENIYNEKRSSLEPYYNAYVKYIKLLPNLQEKLDKMTNELREDYEQVVGVFVRSNANAREQPRQRMPTREEYLEAIDKLDKTKKTKYFLRVDNDDDLNFYKEKLTPNYYTNISRSKDMLNDALHVSSDKYMKKEELEDTFLEVALLSKCDILIHCASNMAITSLVMNKNQKSIFLG